METAVFGVGPAHGSYQGFLLTLDEANIRTDAEELETFLGLPAGSIDGLVANGWKRFPDQQ